MTLNPLTIWAPFILLMILMRRDRRQLARWPLVGLLLTGAVLGGYGLCRLLVWHRPLSSRDAVFIYLTLGAAGGFMVPALFAWVRALVRREWQWVLRRLRREAQWLALCGGLGIVAAGVYFAYGTQLAARGAFDRDDTLFWADTEVYTHVFRGTARDHQQVTHKHPLTPLLGQALFRLAALFVGPRWAPLGVSSAAGGLCVALAALYFRAVCGNCLLGLLGALLLGSTAAHLVFAALPETYTLAAAALILVHLLLTQHHAPTLRFRHHVAAAVLSAGITITNALPALVCFLCRHPSHRRRRVVLRWIACTALLGCLALTVQTYLLPAAALGITPEQYTGEARFMSTADSPWQVAANLARGVCVQNVVGASLRLTDHKGRPVVCVGPLRGRLGRLTGVLWLVLALGAVAVLVRARAWQQPTLVAAVICLGLVAVVHTFYGNQQLFLYSCTYTFYVLAILAHALPHVRRPAAIVMLALFGSVLVVNNALFCARILTTLEQLPADTGVSP